MQKRNQIAIIIAIIFIMTLIYISAFTTMNCDKEFHVGRLTELANEIKEIGILNYPYYINFEAFGNMGYATETFYSDFFLIIPALMINLGFDINLVYAITIFVSFCFILISSFLAFNCFIKDKENAIYYSIFYTFSSFIIFETLERNALGTNFAYIFVPWVILSFIHILSDKRNKHDWIILGVSMACLLLSHIQTSIIVTIGLLIYAILNVRYVINNPKVIIMLLGSIVIAVLLDAFFIFPLIEQVIFQKLYLIEKPFTYMNNAYINLLNIILPNYIWNNIIPKDLIIQNNQITNIIQRTWSIPATFIPTFLMIAIIAWKKIWKNKDIKNLFIISIFAIMISFTPILGFFKILSFIQFPWRIITLAMIFLPIAFAETNKIDNKIKYRIAIITLVNGAFYLCIIIIFFGHSHTYTKTIGRGEYLPTEIPSYVLGYEYITDIEVYNYKNGYMIKNIDTNNGETELPIVYYKGYKVYEIDENNKKHELQQVVKSKNGLINVKNVKQNNLNVIYEGTLIQKITKTISLISFLILFNAIIVKRIIINRFFEKNS